MIPRLNHRELVRSAAEMHGDLADQASGTFESGLQASIAMIHTGEAHERALSTEREYAGKRGVCIDCDNPISPKRLAAKKHAVRCLRCQTKHEEGMN